MKFNEFYVVEEELENNKISRFVIYTDDIDEVLETEYKDSNIKIIEEKDYKISDYCTIVESLLEDVNAHKYCNKIYDIIEIMRSVLITEDAILDFAREYTYHMFELYGY